MDKRGRMIARANGKRNNIEGRHIKEKKRNIRKNKIWRIKVWVNEKRDNLKKKTSAYWHRRDIYKKVTRKKRDRKIERMIVREKWKRDSIDKIERQMQTYIEGKERVISERINQNK